MRTDIAFGQIQGRSAAVAAERVDVVRIGIPVLLLLKTGQFQAQMLLLLLQLTAVLHEEPELHTDVRGPLIAGGAVIMQDQGTEEAVGNGGVPRQIGGEVRFREHFHLLRIGGVVNGGHLAAHIAEERVQGEVRTT